MESVIAACFDVYYYENYAKASCVVFQKDKEEHILAEYNVLVHEINEYIPKLSIYMAIPFYKIVLEYIRLSH